MTDRAQLHTPSRTIAKTIGSRVNCVRHVVPQAVEVEEEVERRVTLIAKRLGWHHTQG